MMLSTSSRQRAEAYIRRAVASGEAPWPALDAYRLRGGRIRWDDWFRLWKRVAHERIEPAASAQARWSAVSGRSPGRPDREAVAGMVGPHLSSDAPSGAAAG